MNRYTDTSETITFPQTTFTGSNYAKDLSTIILILYHQIDEDGKAASDGRLRVGDVVIAVNDVDVSGHDEAIQVIQSAFKTLTITVKR